MAIKILDRHLSQHPGVYDRFISEARAVTRIKHENVIDIFDFGKTEDDCLYCVMELLEGCELAQLMAEQGTLTLEQIAPLLKQMAAALDAAHECGVIHRDLKPENVFVLSGEPLRVRILDFGIAKLLEQEEGDPASSSPASTIPGTVLGTPLTISPSKQRPRRPGEPGDRHLFAGYYSLRDDKRPPPILQRADRRAVGPPY